MRNQTVTYSYEQRFVTVAAGLAFFAALILFIVHAIGALYEYVWALL